MAAIIIPHNWKTQPQYPVELSRDFLTGGSSFLVSAGYGRKPITKSGTSTGNVPNSRAISANIGGKGFTYATGGGGDFLGSLIPSASTNLLTLFSVFIVKSGVAWSTTLYDRNALYGPTFGSNGLKYQYQFDGTEWAYETGLTFSAGKIVCAAHSIFPDKVICVVDGKSNVRTVTNAARTTHEFYLGQDITGSDRTLNGDILLAGVIHGKAWSEAQLLEWTKNPWQIFQPIQRRIWLPSAATGGSTLLPSLVTDGDTFHAASVSAGAVTLTPALYSDGDTFYAATVTLGGSAQNLAPALFADGDTFQNATVAAGSVNLAPSLVTNGDTFHSATVAAGSVTLLPSLVSDGDTFYTHALVLEGGPQTLSPDLFADGDTFHAATVTPGAVTLTPSLYTDADTFHAAEIASGFNLQPPAYADPDTFYTATVAVGAVTLAPDLFADGDTFYPATVANAGVQTLEPGLLADADTFYVPTVTGGARTIGAARSAGRQAQTGSRSNIQTNRR